ncbi:MAG: CatA-like O-acetyltransferase [Marinisporobacter sp.]|jgi:chloramphenicol O-acetyltransferase type A|nr:CatA-like O-acetyltransferase [Marinisporobacter sp.]
MNTNFNPIDIQTWSRGQMFHYFSVMAPTSYSITVELDITNFKNVYDNLKLVLSKVG